MIRFLPSLCTTTFLLTMITDTQTSGFSQRITLWKESSWLKGYSWWQIGVSVSIALIVLALILSLAIAIPKHMNDIDALETRIARLEAAGKPSAKSNGRKAHDSDSDSDDGTIGADGVEGFENTVATKAELLGENRQDHYALNMTLGNIDSNHYVEFTQPGQVSRAIPLPNNSIALL